MMGLRYDGGTYWCVFYQALRIPVSAPGPRVTNLLVAGYKLYAKRSTHGVTNNSSLGPNERDTRTKVLSLSLAQLPVLSVSAISTPGDTAS